MLIKCPECELQVSDKAFACPHCGYPMAKQVAINNRKKPAKRRRLPNGFGRITELKNRNLRKPFRAMVTVGFAENGRPIGKLLKPEAYFATYNEAYAALIEYNKNPCSLEISISVEELYEKWTTEYFKNLKSKSSERTITSAWAYCSSMYGMRACDIRARHVKYCIEEGTVTDKDGNIHGASPSTKSRIKSLWNLMLDYALEYEIVDRNYARTFELSKETVRERDEAVRGHMTYSEQEMEKLWKNIKIPYVDVFLIQCYSGWRPQELGLIRLDDVDLENWTFCGGMKSKAGTNRIVPIHSKIRPLVQARYEEAVQLGSWYLLNCTDAQTHSNIKLTYDKISYRYEKIKEVLQLDPGHRPHDGRKQFITMCKRAGVDDFAIKRMIGHEIDDITEKIYTDRGVDWLQGEIEKIKE